MGARFVGVVTAFAAIVVVLATVVLTIAAIQDYQENKGGSFIERAASIVGVGTLTEEAVQVRVEVDDEDVDRPDIFRFFGRSEDDGEWLDDLFDRERMDRDYEFRFEDRVERSTPFEGFLRLPSDRWEFEGSWGSDWEWIDQLVERGFMTEEGADEFRSWFEGLPKDFDEWGPDFSKDGDFEFDSDDGRFRFRWRWDGSDDDWFFERDPEYDKGRKNGV